MVVFKPLAPPIQKSVEATKYNYNNIKRMVAATFCCIGHKKSFEKKHQNMMRINFFSKIWV